MPRKSLFSRLFAIICVLTLLPVYEVSADAKIDPPSVYEIFTFKGNDAFSATITRYESQGDKLHSVSHSAYMYASTCNDILGDFQSSILERFRDSGYITEEMFNDLTDLIKSGIKPSQLVLLRQFSLMSESEAKRLNIPDNRITKSREGMVEVSRGNLYAVRGFHVVADSKNSHKIEPLPVPYEFDAIPGLRKFNRSKVPLLVEIGRAYMETEQLSGDFKTSAHLIFSTLSSEARILGVNPERMIIAAHSFRGAHDKVAAARARLFVRMFPGRVLTNHLIEQIENHPNDILPTYMNEPLPTTEEWAALNNSVVFGTIKEVAKKFVPSSISAMAEQIVIASRGLLTPDKALALYQEWMAFTNQDYVLTVEGKEFKTPIRTFDPVSSVMVVNFMRIMKRYGIAPSHPVFQDVGDLLQSKDGAYDVDAFHDEYMNANIIVPLYFKDGQKNPTRALTISNFDPRELPMANLAYVAGAILAYDKINRDTYLSMDDQEISVVSNYVEGSRQDLGLPPINTLSMEELYEMTPIIAASTAPAINEQFEKLGGVKVRMPFAFVNMPKGHIEDIHAFDNVGIQTGITYGYKFELDQIEAIRQRFPKWKYSLEPRQHKAHGQLLWRTAL